MDVSQPPPPAAPAPAPVQPAARIERIASDAGGGDPLVRSFLEAHRADCAWTTLSWTWALIGAVAALVGGAIGSRLAGAPRAMPEDVSSFARWMNDHFGNSLGCLLGMVVGAAIASTIGVRLKPRGVPAGQEPWIGFVVIGLVYLLFYDYLVCLGVVTGALCVIYFLAITFRVMAVAIGGHQGLRSDALTEPPGGWPLYTVLVPLYKERNVARNILVSLGKLDYPRDRLDVKFLLEADDPETLQAIEQAGIPAWAEVVVVPQ